MHTAVSIFLAFALSFSIGGTVLESNQGSSQENSQGDTQVIPPETPPETTESKGLIVIDAGHQLNGNSAQEPIGPGASTTKAKVASGTTGAFTGIPEYVLTLAVALMLEDILVEMGYEVVQIRSTHDVDISNAERAIIANELNADAFIRLHGNGFSDSSVNGALTMCMTANNPYCAYLYQDSRLLSELVLDGIIEETGANRRTILESDTMSGLNWCEVPVTIVEMGFMSNQKEDELLATDEYRYAMAMGIAIGIERYMDSTK